jgi:hypothetical protein
VLFLRVNRTWIECVDASISQRQVVGDLLMRLAMVANSEALALHVPVDCIDGVVKATERLIDSSAKRAKKSPLVHLRVQSCFEYACSFLQSPPLLRHVQQALAKPSTETSSRALLEVLPIVHSLKALGKQRLPALLPSVSDAFLAWLVKRRTVVVDVPLPALAPLSASAAALSVLSSHEMPAGASKCAVVVESRDASLGSFEVVLTKHVPPIVVSADVTGSPSASAAPSARSDKSVVTSTSPVSVSGVSVGKAKGKDKDGDEGKTTPVVAWRSKPTATSTPAAKKPASSASVTLSSTTPVRGSGGGRGRGRDKGSTVAVAAPRAAGPVAAPPAPPLQVESVGISPAVVRRASQVGSSPALIPCRRMALLHAPSSITVDGASRLELTFAERVSAVQCSAVATITPCLKALVCTGGMVWRALTCRCCFLNIVCLQSSRITTLTRGGATRCTRCLRQRVTPLWSRLPSSTAGLCAWCRCRPRSLCLATGVRSGWLSWTPCVPMPASLLASCHSRALGRLLALQWACSPMPSNVRT